MGQKLKIAGWVGIGRHGGRVNHRFTANSGTRYAGATAARRIAAALGGFWHGQKRLCRAGRREKAHHRSHCWHGRPVSTPTRSTSTKNPSRNFKEGTSGQFVGVGIEITQEDGLVKVVSPIEGSPAFRAGLKSNDLITKVDDTAVKGMTLNDAVKRMRGEPNTKVVLTIYRKDENRTFPVTITREEIKQQSVRGKVVEPGYAWIRVSQFQERTVDDFAKKLDRNLQTRTQTQRLGLGLAQ